MSPLPQDLSTEPVSFPSPSPAHGCEQTTLIVQPAGDRLPLVRWVGSLTDSAASDRLAPRPTGSGTEKSAAGWAAAWTAAAGPWRGCPLLIEHSRGVFLRPGLRGHRLAAGGGSDAAGLTGRDWSTAFRLSGVAMNAQQLVLNAVD